MSYSDRAETTGPRVNVELEQQVLGAVLLEETCFPTVAALLSANDFGLPRHSTIFQAMLALSERQQPLDYLTVGEQLKTMGRFQTVGGLQYLCELTETTPTVAHLESYCERLATLAAARRVFDVARRIAQRFKDPTVPPEEVVEQALAEMGSVSPPSADKLVSMHDSLEAVMKAIEDSARSTVTRVPTGLGGLDELTAGGPAAGQLWIVAGRPAMGKSTAGLQMALAAAQTGPVLFATIEMSHIELTQRALAGAARVDHDRLRRRDLTPEDWGEIVASMTNLESLPLHYLDASALTLSRLRVKARALKAQHGLRAIYIDYLGKMRGEGEFETRALEISSISGGLKALAKELDVPVIALAQLNRDCEKRTDKRPMQSDLRDGGSVEQDADVIVFLYRDWVYNKSTPVPDATEFIVAKQRDGAADTAFAMFERHLSCFRDPTPEELDSIKAGHPPRSGGSGGRGGKGAGPNGKSYN